MGQQGRDLQTVDLGDLLLLLKEYPTSKRIPLASAFSHLIMGAGGMVHVFS